MNSATVRQVELPEKFVVEPSPDVSEGRLEFVQDPNAKGVVHRVKIDMRSLLELDDPGSSAEDLDTETFYKEERMNSRARISGALAAREMKEGVMVVRRKSNRNKRMEKVNLFVGTSLGLLFFGFLVGSETTQNAIYGYIGAVVAFALGNVVIYAVHGFDK